MGKIIFIHASSSRLRAMEMLELESKKGNETIRIIIILTKNILEHSVPLARELTSEDYSICAGVSGAPKCHCENCTGYQEIHSLLAERLAHERQKATL